MEKSGDFNEFDQLYTDLCNRLREMGKAASFCQLIKNAPTDLNRIAILNKDCNIVPSVIKTVKECKGNNTKNPQQARKMLEEFHRERENCSESDNLIRLLNAALVHAQIDNEFDHKQLEDFKKDEVFFLENLLVDGAELGVSEENLLVSQIYRERANHWHHAGDYEMSVIEAIRAIRYAKFNKNNPNEYLFVLLFRLSESLRHLSQWPLATNVIQFSIKLLRSSSLDNKVKSIETVRLVKLLKEIQIVSKQNGDNGRRTIDFQCFLEPIKIDFPKIFHSTSDKLLNCSNSLELNFDAERGRHIIATETIPPGATIIVEEPFSWIVHPNESCSYCQNCCRKVNNLISCGKCSSVVFCSKECQAASETYHQYECEFVKSITTSDILGDMALLCYRTITRTDFNILKSHIREYLRLLEDQKDNPESERIFHEKFILGLDEQGKLDSSNYTSVFAQTPNTDVRNGGDLLKRSFSAIVLTICLRLSGYFKNVEENDSEANLSDTEELIASLFLRHLQSASCNAYGINNMTGCDPRRLEVNEIGGATYPIISTTNHSCNSNIYRFSVGKTCIVKSLREIRPGEEILDSYGPHFASNSIEERFRLLNGQYLFTCSCSACTEHWLVYPQLPIDDPFFKCAKCETGICIKAKGKHICSECKSVFDSRKSLKMAAECRKEFEAVKKLLLSSSKLSTMEYDAVQSSIVKYSNVLAITQKWPCQMLVECQEALKLCWNLESRAKS